MGKRQRNVSANSRIERVMALSFTEGFYVWQVNNFKWLKSGVKRLENEINDINLFADLSRHWHRVLECCDCSVSSPCENLFLAVRSDFCLPNLRHRADQTAIHSDDVRLKLN